MNLGEKNAISRSANLPFSSFIFFKENPLLHLLPLLFLLFMPRLTIALSSLCLSVHLSVCLTVCLSACLSVCLSICLSVCVSACLPVCLLVFSFEVPQTNTNLRTTKSNDVFTIISTYSPRCRVRGEKSGRQHHTLISIVMFRSVTMILEDLNELSVAKGVLKVLK